MKSDGRVKIYIETMDERNGFHNATCWLPDYAWEAHNYSEVEMYYFKQFVRNNAHPFMQFSQEGVKLGASDFPYIEDASEVKRP